MRKRIAMSAVALALSCGMVASYNAPEENIQADSISDKKDSISNLEKKKQEMEKTLKSLETKKNNLDAYIKELDEKLAQLEEDLDKLNTEIDAVSAQLDVTKKELKAAKKKEKDQYNAMLSRIKYNYENGQKSTLALLFESDSIVDFMNNALYAREMAKFDRNMYDDYTKAKETVAKKEKEQEEQLAQLEELKETQEYEKKAVEKLIKNKKKEIEEYEASIADSEDELKKYASKIKSEEAALEQLLEQQRQAAIEAERKRKREAKNNSNNNDTNNNTNTSTPTNTGNESFIWPCPSSHRITSYFGPRTSPRPGASSYHKGIDIGAPAGSTIVAAKSGTVVTSTYSSSCGNYVMLYHGDGMYTYYMHASALLVNVGDTVNQGDAIARVGSTGISTGPHLHFAVTKNSTYLNPLSYVSP